MLGFPLDNCVMLHLEQKTNLVAYSTRLKTQYFKDD